MKTCTADELKAVLESHAKWFRRDTGGACANLYGANLTDANLVGANLTRANLYGANLTRANLTGANLYSANLYGANLGRANLTDANLGSANLYSANLYGANLGSANLTGANLTRANLVGANLVGVSLVGRSVCPEAGGFIAYKKVFADSSPVILELHIPTDALRVSALCGRKCRASKATPLRAFTLDGSISEAPRFRSSHDYEFTYEIGKVATPASFDEDRRVDCTNGIHFFMERAEAEAY